MLEEQKILDRPGPRPITNISHLPDAPPFSFGTIKVNRCSSKKYTTTQYIDNAPLYLKGLSHEIDFKNFDKNLQNLA